MFRSILLPVLFLASSCSCSFGQEFTEYADGLIYNEATMNALRHIVDSINIKYRKCDPWKDYFSLPQAYCHVVSIDSFNVKNALYDLKTNISFEDFRNKYPTATVQKNLVALKEKSNYNGDSKISFSTLELTHGFSYEIENSDTTLFDKNLSGTWQFEYSPKTEYSQESIKAFYFATDFKRVKIPEKYARMIQYADCMIDTNSSILLPGAKESYRPFWYAGNEKKKSKKTPERTKLATYIDKHTAMPRKKEYRIDSVYEDAYYSWLDKKDSLIDTLLANRDDFKQLLRAAIEEVVKAGISDDELEKWTARYDSKEHALQMKRLRIVIGGCSQDSRPRVHAQEIAVLAAETVNWDIFLRAHLDIMNDRFQRVTDGSYAWAGRNTYIKELEKLDFDVTTLLMGIALRIDNPSGNHYFGSIGRLGRALSETEYSRQIEQAMTGAIQDDQLDDFNRILIYYLYKNYIYHVKDTARKMDNISHLKSAVAMLPKEYREYIVVNEDDYIKNE